MFKKILLVIAIAIGAFVVVAALQPADYHLARSATMSASPLAVFAQVNDFHRWQAWSPWEKLDPTMKRTFEGPAAGTGAVYRWAGNNQVGEGSMTIIESRPNELVRIKLDFVKPFASTASAEFAFKREGNQTVVRWSMSGVKNFVSKAMCLFVSMDKMIGGEFEKGLADLKVVAEAANGSVASGGTR